MVVLTQVIAITWVIYSLILRGHVPRFLPFNSTDF